MFDQLRLQQELSCFSAKDWTKSSQPDCEYISLVSVGGVPNEDYAISGPMAPTAFLENCTYIKQIIQSRSPVSRCRLLRGQEQIFPIYHWFHYQPVHFNITYNIDLIIEQHKNKNQTDQMIAPYKFEVLTPEEINKLTSGKEFSNLPMESFKRQWQKAFNYFGHHSSGELTYLGLIEEFKKFTKPINNCASVKVITSMLLAAPPAPKRIGSRLITRHKQRKKTKSKKIESEMPPEFSNPIFIVSAPRAGSTLLFETLALFPEIWTIGGESHAIFEDIPELHPAAKNYSSNRLTAADADPRIATLLKKGFIRQLQNQKGDFYLHMPLHQRPSSLCFMEKTPKNALRIPFLKAVFKSIKFIYLYRDPEENISSMMEGWRSRRFTAYSQMPGWPYPEWSFLLPPHWEALQGKSIAEIAAYQWKSANQHIIDDLRALPASEWCLVHYNDLLTTPMKIIKQISKFAGLTWNDQIEETLARPLPLAQRTLSAPSRNKWHKNKHAIKKFLPDLESIIIHLKDKNHN